MSFLKKKFAHPHFLALFWDSKWSEDMRLCELRRFFVGETEQSLSRLQAKPYFLLKSKYLVTHCTNSNDFAESFRQNSHLLHGETLFYSFFREKFPKRANFGYFDDTLSYYKSFIFAWKVWNHLDFAQAWVIDSFYYRMLKCDCDAKIFR